MTLGGLLSKAKPPQAESERNHMFHWTGRSITLGGYSVYLMSAAGHLDLSVARSLSHIWLMLKHAPRHLQNTRVVLCAHCVLLFFVWIFSSRTESPSASQKVSKRNQAMRFGLSVAKRWS